AAVKDIVISIMLNNFHVSSNKKGRQLTALIISHLLPLNHPGESLHSLDRIINGQQFDVRRIHEVIDDIIMRVGVIVSKGAVLSDNFSKHRVLFWQNHAPGFNNWLSIHSSGNFVFVTLQWSDGYRSLFP